MGFQPIHTMSVFWKNRQLKLISSWSCPRRLLEEISYTSAPWLTMRLPPDKLIVSWKYHRPKMHLIWLAYQTSELGLVTFGVLRIYISLQLGNRQDSSLSLISFLPLQSWSPGWLPSISKEDHAVFRERISLLHHSKVKKLFSQTIISKEPSVLSKGTQLQLNLKEFQQIKSQETEIQKETRNKSKEHKQAAAEYADTLIHVADWVLWKQPQGQTLEYSAY